MLSEEASSQTSVFEDAEQAETALDRFVSGISGAEVGDCVGDLLKESAPAENQEEFEVGEVEVGELNVTLPDVEQATAWQIAVTLEFTSGEAAGLSPEIYIDQIHVREGDAIATLQTVDVLTPFDPELRDELLQQSQTASPSSSIPRAQAVNDRAPYLSRTGFDHCPPPRYTSTNPLPALTVVPTGGSAYQRCDHRYGCSSRCSRCPFPLAPIHH